MITFFTIPKPFIDKRIITIQTNALNNWLATQSEIELILLGREKGVKDIASKIGAKYESSLDYKNNTPLLDSAFRLANEKAAGNILAFINTDIIFFENISEIIQLIQKKKYLMIGQRHDLDIDYIIDYKKPDWRSELKAELKEKGKLHNLAAIDYFIFNKNLFNNIPPFLVGRSGYDNWLIYYARQMGVAVIDATRAITAIHQNHDYSHHPDGKEGAYLGKEAQENFILAGNKFFLIDDANYFFDSRRQLKLRIFSDVDSLRNYIIHTLPELHPMLSPLVIKIRKIYKILKNIFYFINSKKKL